MSARILGVIFGTLIWIAVVLSPAFFILKALGFSNENALIGALLLVIAVNSTVALINRYPGVFRGPSRP